MAYLKVNEASLTAVADAIRTKGGTTEPLAFPTEFVSAIEAIQSGGGGDTLDALINGTLTEYSTDSADNPIRAYLFYGCSSLVSFSAPNALGLGIQMFRDCKGLKNVYAPKVRRFLGDTFSGCSALEEVTFPELYDLDMNAFLNCTSLRVCDFTNAVTFNSGCFQKCANLKTLILRKKSAITGLWSTSVFNGTPFASGGSGGTVYVPSELIESYQTATNWSTLYAGGTCNFVAIEGSEYE